MALAFLLPLQVNYAITFQKKVCEAVFIGFTISNYAQFYEQKYFFSKFSSKEEKKICFSGTF